MPMLHDNTSYCFIQQKNVIIVVRIFWYIHTLYNVITYKITYKDTFDF